MQKYAQLFLTGKKIKSNGFGNSPVFAFTSCSEGEGVSYVAQSFGAEIARTTNQRTLVADAERLRNISIGHFSEIPSFCHRTDIPDLWVLPGINEAFQTGSPGALTLNTNGMTNYLKTSIDNLRFLRSAFDYVLIDCAPLSLSGEAALLAPETDGVIVVVEADRTRREQIDSAKKTIGSADGNLIGFVLNKRQYPVPNWLYKRI